MSRRSRSTRSRSGSSVKTAPHRAVAGRPRAAGPDQARTRRRRHRVGPGHAKPRPKVTPPSRWVACGRGIVIIVIVVGRARRRHHRRFAGRPGAAAVEHPEVPGEPPRPAHVERRRRSRSRTTCADRWSSSSRRSPSPKSSTASRARRRPSSNPRSSRSRAYATGSAETRGALSGLSRAPCAGARSTTRRGTSSKRRCCSPTSACRRRSGCSTRSATGPRRSRSPNPTRSSDLLQRRGRRTLLARRPDRDAARTSPANRTSGCSSA